MIRKAARFVVSMVSLVVMIVLFIVPAVAGVMVGVELWLVLGGGWLGLIVGCMAATVIECMALVGLTMVGIMR